MKTSKSSLAQKCAELEKENGVLSCALNDVLKGDVRWFGSPRTFALGVTRPKSACGGIAIIRHCGTSSAHYFEEYAQRELAHIALVITGENTEHNRELLARRNAIEAAKAYIAEQVRAA
jgi:hypothetical protein